MPIDVLSISDGPSTTVSELLGNPLLIPARILDILKNKFISETLLRNAGGNTNGLVEYFESSPLYLGKDVELVAEFAEIPVGAGQLGLPRIAVGTKEGLGVRISREMRDENKMDLVNRQLLQLSNTMVRAEERALRVLLSNPAIPTIPAAAAWTAPGARVRDDLFNAKEVIMSATPTASQGDDIFGFEPDTVVMHGSVEAVLGRNDAFNSVYRNSPLVTEDISYSGKLPQKVIDLDALKTRTWDKTRVLVLERNTIGFYSDTRILQATALYGEGNGPNGGPTESWRSDATRKRVNGVDQPLAACWVTGVQAA